METTGLNDSDQVRFRFANRDDVPSIVALLAEDTLGQVREQGDMDQYFTAFTEMSAQDGNKYLLAIDSRDAVVGCVQITLVPGLSRAGMKRALLEGVRVSDNVRGQGVGRLMLAEAHEIAVRQGCGIAQMTSDISREDALRFYKSLGYVDSHFGLKLAL